MCLVVAAGCMFIHTARSLVCSVLCLQYEIRIRKSRMKFVYECCEAMMRLRVDPFSSRIQLSLLLRWPRLPKKEAGVKLRTM